MENRYKRGKAISDNEIKTIKKFIKNQVLTVSKISDDIYIDSDLINAKIKINNIRKYNTSFRGFTYEVDVTIDLGSSSYRSNSYCQSRSRRYNSWYRSSIANALYSESFLKYFNIDVNNNVTISKITYGPIV